MNEAIRTRNPWRTAAIMLLAVLVLVLVALASMLRPAPTTEASTPAAHPGVHAPSAVVVGTGANYGEGWNNYGHDAPLPQPAQTGDGADSAVDRHAEVVARYKDSPR
jgi:hypothetical protein